MKPAKLAGNSRPSAAGPSPKEAPTNGSEHAQRAEVDRIEEEGGEAGGRDQPPRGATDPGVFFESQESPPLTACHR